MAVTKHMSCRRQDPLLHHTSFLPHRRVTRLRRLPTFQPYPQMLIYNHPHLYGILMSQ